MGPLERVSGYNNIHVLLKRGAGIVTIHMNTISPQHKIEKPSLTTSLITTLPLSICRTSTYFRYFSSLFMKVNF